jgi:hypothetical protein
MRHRLGLLLAEDLSVSLFCVDGLFACWFDFVICFVSTLLALALMTLGWLLGRPLQHHPWCAPRNAWPARNRALVHATERSGTAWAEGLLRWQPLHVFALACTAIILLPKLKPRITSGAGVLSYATC